MQHLNDPYIAEQIFYTVYFNNLGRKKKAAGAFPDKKIAPSYLLLLSEYEILEVSQHGVVDHVRRGRSPEGVRLRPLPGEVKVCPLNLRPTEKQTKKKQ